jgi:hypothetical protein
MFLLSGVACSFHLICGRTLFVCSEVGGSNLFQNLVSYVPLQNTLYSRILTSSIPLWEPKKFLLFVVLVMQYGEKI